jgi:sterol desaturase/sphingolipid hydroxylase (fatty acid hydroxylase superfamily)
MIPDEPLWRMAIFASVFAGLALIELVAPFRHDAHRLSRRTGNLGIFLIGMFAGRIVLPIGVVGFAGLIDQYGWGLFNQLAMPALLENALTMVLLDLAIWAQHVVFHKLPVLWRLHRMHHADTHLDFTSGLRFHPLEILVSITWKLAVIALLGASAFAVFLFAIILNSGAMITHANWRLPARAEAAIRLIFVTPGMHRVHHSVDPVDTNSNYGFNLAIWDRMFGTYRHAPLPGAEAITFGLAEFRDPREHHVDRLLTQPFRNSPDAQDP